MLKQLGHVAKRASEKRGVAGVSGITLVLVPTLFTVFPHWATWPLLPKLGVLLLWLISGVIIVARTIEMEQRIKQLGEHQVSVEQKARTQTLRASVDAVLNEFERHLPTGYRPQLFLPDPARKRLIPARDPHLVGPDDGWRVDQDPPQAVTGAAWTTNAYLFAKGSALSDAKYGLTSEQQRAYMRLTGVSATPVRNRFGSPIGVLTVSTEEPGPQVSERDFVELQVACAAKLAPALEDLGASVESV
jgi:hypothetical protein